MSFFVTLPSNSSFDTFPNNTQSNFNTLLKQSLTLDGAYDVALTEISVPTNFNVKLGKISFQNPFFNPNEAVPRKRQLLLNLVCKNGQSSEHFCDEINLLIEKCVIFEEYLFRWLLVNQIKKYSINRNDTKQYFLLKVQNSNNPNIFQYQILDSESTTFENTYKMDGGKMLLPINPTFYVLII